VRGNPHSFPPLESRFLVVVYGFGTGWFELGAGKNFGSWGRSLFPTGETPVLGTPPYSTVADPELLNTVLRVLSCGSEWGRMAPHRRPTRFASRLHLAERLRTVIERLLTGQERAKKPYSTRKSPESGTLEHSLHPGGHRFEPRRHPVPAETSEEAPGAPGAESCTAH